MRAPSHGHSLLTGKRFYFDSEQVPAWNPNQFRLEKIQTLLHQARQQRGHAVQAVLRRAFRNWLLPQEKESGVRHLIRRWLWISAFSSTLYVGLYFAKWMSR